MGGQGQPTPIHTQRPTQPPFQHRHIHQMHLKRLFLRFLTRVHGRTDGPTDGRTDKASYGVACPQLKKLCCADTLQTALPLCKSLVELGPTDQRPRPLEIISNCHNFE